MKIMKIIFILTVLEDNAAAIFRTDMVGSGTKNPLDFSRG